MTIKQKWGVYVVLRMLLAISLFFFFEYSHAEDIYNFYFQKKQNKKERVKSEKPASPAPVVEKIKTQVDVPKSKNHKSWELQLGVGNVSGSMPVSYQGPSTSSGKWGAYHSYIQPMYVLGGKYYFNRYFDVHTNLLLPRGEMSTAATAYNGQEFVPVNRDSTLDFQLLLGGGVTPFHFDFLGFTFMEIGAHVGFLMGDENYLGGNSVALMWGPRIGFNFSRSFGLNIEARQELTRSGGSDIFQAALNMGYRW